MSMAIGLGLGLSYGQSGGAAAAALSLPFATTGTLDSRITFTRASTGTYFNSSGTLVSAANDVARFDYNPVGLAARGLLIEEARTNIILRSEEVENASWTNGALTITANATVAPSGATTADFLVPTAASAAHYALANVATVTGQYAVTMFVKAGGYNKVAIRESATTGAYASFNLSTVSVIETATVGSVAINSATIISVGGGWYRLTVICTVTGTFGCGWALHLVPAGYTTGDPFTSWTGDAVNGVYLWGGQSEAGAFATSYIPTTNATVTRAVDVATMTGTNFSSWYNASEGTFVAEFDSPALGTRAISSADDGTANAQVELYTSVTDPKFLVTVGGASQADIDAGTIAANVASKLAGAYKLNDFAASVSGGAAVTDVVGTIPTVDRLRLGTDFTGNALNGHIKSLTFYNTRKTNAEIAVLTT